MQRAIPFIDLIEPAMFIVGGVWCLYCWPRSLRQQIDRAEIDAFEGLKKIRRAQVFGYMALLLAIGITLGTLEQFHAFGRSIFGAALFCVSAIGVLVWWQFQKKKLE